METVQTSVSALWQGGFAGEGALRLAPGVLPVDLPTEFGGRGAAYSPEDLLTGALASCLAATSGIVLTMQKIPFEQVNVTAQLTTAKGRPPRVVAARFRIVVRSSANQDEVSAAVHRAEALCLVAGSLRADIERTLEVGVEL